MNRMPWDKVKANLFFLLKPDTKIIEIMRAGQTTAVIMGIEKFRELRIDQAEKLSLIELKEYFDKWSQRSSKAAIVSVNNREMIAIMGINLYRMRTRDFQLLKGGKNKTSG